MTIASSEGGSHNIFLALHIWFVCRLSIDLCYCKKRQWAFIVYVVQYDVQFPIAPFFN